PASRRLRRPSSASCNGRWPVKELGLNDSSLSHSAADVALLYPGDRAMRERADPGESRFAALFDTFGAAGIGAAPAVYHDDFADEVEAQLRGVQVVLCWCNPI